MEKFNLPTPESVFDLDFFSKNPAPFVTLAKDLLPGAHKPTTSHFFFKLLEQKTVLARVYTQNIDDLELYAGVSKDLLVQAHGTFSTGRCIQCKREHEQSFYRSAIKNGQTPLCKNCKGYVKPDVVFFNEDLPRRFYGMRRTDFRDAELLIVMGTSLAVSPVNQLIDKVPASCHRLLMNREVVAGDFFLQRSRWVDVMSGVFLGDCDDACTKFAELCGWKEELETVVQEGLASFDKRVRAALKDKPANAPM